MAQVIATVTFVQEGPGQVRAITDFKGSIAPKAMMGMLGQALAALYNVARQIGVKNGVAENEINQILFPNASRK